MKILASLDALLITNQTNIRYLTGFVGVDAREREAYLLLASNQCYLFTNSLYREQAKNAKCTMPNATLTFVEISRENPIGKELKRVLQKTVFVQRQSSSKALLELEEADLTVAEYTKLKKELKGVKLIPTQNRIEELRMIKRTDEIENIRAAAKLTDACFTFILSKLTPGVEEGEIAWEIESFFRKRGATLAFSPIVAFGKNSSQPHYSPSNSRSFDFAQDKQSGILQKQDVALFDFGARVNGYCSDMTRVVFIGKPKDEWRRTYQTVLEAQQAALEYLQAQGRALSSQLSGGKADRIARAVIQKAGLPPYPHSLGHAVGLDIHEAPRLTVKKNQILKPNMVVTVEPGVYVEGQYGIRIEDLILLKKDSIEVLSKSPKELIIL
ncbi:MAG: Xaa-Pro aminopeptidase [Candidatus Gottesmanbacteria bacterium GW2011_GWA2_47_9]|uniref:Xaa-Pro aminopeptidase n=1 Tax=Candidatus Gottesmanbacteria bacterium GW2011_GWA2_47_9 TaxID=1618445 RepID=A0A0G1U145_9BACT|nr:MAG: Xaa-Pro aminopeptidase [Candidatus Gottesmanbacteria bacterium GW2011_GWA2_47_9]